MYPSPISSSSEELIGKAVIQSAAPHENLGAITAAYLIVFYLSVSRLYPIPEMEKFS